MTAERQPLSKLLRVAISILIVGHLLAVVLPPLSFQARGPLGLSPSVATAFAPLEGYSQFLYIDRGYAFFAPDPGPSHLIQAAITDHNGQRVEIMYPDLQQQWPRLLYHRHFMLAEFLEQIYQPPGPPQELVELDQVEAERWVRSRARYEHVRQSMVDHLKHEHPGREVAIQRLEHLIPNVIEFQREPIALNDRRLYRVMLDQAIEFDSQDDLAAPIGPTETIPPPLGAARQETAPSSASDPETPAVNETGTGELKDKKPSESADDEGAANAEPQDEAGKSEGAADEGDSR